MRLFNMRTKSYRIITFKEKYFSFDGRIDCKEYMLRSLWVLFVSFVFSIYMLAFIVLAGLHSFASIMILPILYWSIAGISWLSLTWRRLQDLNYSGRYSIALYILGFIPFMNIISFSLSVPLMFKKGDTGPNEYGNDPAEEKIIGRDCTEQYIFWPAFILLVIFLIYNFFPTSLF